MFRTLTTAGMQSYKEHCPNPFIMIDTGRLFVAYDINNPTLTPEHIREHARSLWETYAEYNQYKEQRTRLVCKLHTPNAAPILIGAVDGDPDEIQTYI